MSFFGHASHAKRVPNPSMPYQKAFKMVFERVSQMLGENVDENTTFEPLKEPVDKEKSRAFGSAHPIWLRG